MRGIGLFSDPRATLGARTITRRRPKNLCSAGSHQRSLPQRLIGTRNDDYLCQQRGHPDQVFGSLGHRWRLFDEPKRVKNMNNGEFWDSIVPELQSMREIFGLPPFSRTTLEIWQLSLSGRHVGDARAAIRSLTSSSDRCPVPSEVKRKLQFFMCVFGEIELPQYAAPESLQ